jgi:hypothetical protein
VGEGVPVKVPSAHSDIDLVALHPLGHAFSLPTGATTGPRLIVETKDEHDWEPSGREFGQLLRTDVAKMGDQPFIPRGTKGVKFSMLREEHFDRAVGLFGDDDFDRVFVVHAIDPGVLAELGLMLSQWRIYWVTVPEIVQDLLRWYQGHEQQTTLRNTLVGDLFHLLIGFCGLELPDNRVPAPN